ncbi:Abi-alpha family protein [Bradyrhizobium sp.]|uniref:Abi-alpha family protein n=1 Tax=Bradyrhizobium sp. TaxID=376 RepID=UPI003C7652EC
MSEIEETAKAVGQVSKLGQALLNKIKDVERIGGQILGPFGQGYGILTDLVRHKREEINWRLKNRLKIYQLAIEEAERRNLQLSDLKTIPGRIAYGYEDGLEKEDDADLQGLWANLLLNVADPTVRIAPKRIYGDILGRLDSECAIFLNELGLRSGLVDFYFVVCGAFLGRRKGSEVAAARPPHLESIPLPLTKLFTHFDDKGSAFFVPWPPERIEAVVDSLQSLGLVHWVTELHMAEELLATDENIRASRTLLEMGQRVLQNAGGVRGFKPSQLGLDFIAAVTPPAPPQASKPRKPLKRRKSR